MVRPDPFGPALQKLAPDEWDVFESPGSFQGYLDEHGLKAATAPSISVDHMEKLAPSLRDRGGMVLRLGTAEDGRTGFALVGGPRAGLDDFFLHDDFEAAVPEWFEPEVSPESLVAYTVFKEPTETTLVNLAFASGLIGRALELDKPYPTVAPATGSSTYDFKFRPHSRMDEVLEHRKGQVEIDAVFVGRRDGKPHLFVLEAKSGTETRTLAKHKLVYPLLALAPRVPAGMPVVPAYLRVVREPGRVVYHVTECSFEQSGEVPALDELRPEVHRCLALRLE